ncbi:MAG: glycosyltransferase [Armatimonadetes bacterium]|nr:glycosyltransferase [Armatimonadota bacterium]
MTASPRAVSVVVPTHNRAPILRRCLEALLAQTLPPDAYEIVVADDGSTDGTAEMVAATAAAAACPVRFATLPRRSGPGAARNLAVREAEGTLVVFVDSDVLVVPEFLAAHVDTHGAQGERILGRGPIIITPHLTLPESPPRGVIDLSTNYLDTANASVARRHLEEAGMFDEQFSVYGWEDLDLGIRLRRLGVRKVHVPAAIAYHYQPELDPERMESLLEKERERAAMAVRFYRKHPGLTSRLAIQWTLFHRALAWVQTAGGLLHEGNVAAAVRWARARGLRTPAFLMLRGVLNRAYLRALRAAWQEQ